MMPIKKCFLLSFWILITAIPVAAQNVGINTSTPLAKFHVDLGASISNGILFTGTEPSGGSFPSFGEGRRFMFYPGRAALRAGYVDGTQWDDAEVGPYSVAFGYNSIARGYGSCSIGDNSIAGGTLSTTFGNSTIAKGYSSFVVGLYNDPLITGADENIPTPTTPIFIVGNGEGGGDRHNAMVLFKNGNLLMKTPTPVLVDPGYLLPPVSGPGTRLMWMPEKSAFRLGTVPDNSWDKDSIGTWSTGIGYSAKAKGTFSLAMGVQTTASGITSTALGYSTTASGENAISMGSVTTASGAVATSMGVNTTAVGDFSTAMGNATTASGLTSTATGYSTVASGENAISMGSVSTASGAVATAMGFNTIASGNQSTAMGNGSKATGNISTAIGAGVEANGGNSIAMGFSTVANGIGSTTMGAFTKATGFYSTAIGTYTTARSYTSVVMGRYNDSIITSFNGAWLPQDPLFMIGNGTSNANRHNAMVVYKNGNLVLKNPSAYYYSKLSDPYPIPVSGEGTRMMWLPEISAFRVGTVTDTAWNTAYIGLGSFASGFNSIASGTASTATGSGNKASGDYSTAMGGGTRARGYSSTVLGLFNDPILTVDEEVVNPLTPLFIIGNGDNLSDRRNAMVVRKDGHVGIGTNVPSTFLHINVGTHISDGMIIEGNSNSEATVPDLGSGSRMVFFPGKSAFRAGAVSSTHWDNSNTGSYSMGLGFNAMARGEASVALGIQTVAEGDYSLAAGASTNALGDYSTAMGEFTSASGLNSTAIGYGNKARSSIAYASGFNNIAKGYSSTVIGMYNDSILTVNETFVNDTTPLFIIGNGTGPAPGQRHNAMVVRNDGYVGIGTSIPAAQLEVNGALAGPAIPGSSSAGMMRIGFGTLEGIDMGIMSTAPYSGWIQKGYSGSAEPLALQPLGGNVGIGTTDPGNKLSVVGNTDVTGNTSVTGYTHLGTGSPNIKMKKLTGTSAGAQNMSVSISHGLTMSKIISVNIIMNVTGFANIPPSFTHNAGYEYQFYITSSNIVVINSATNSINILNKTFTILVVYEE